MEKSDATVATACLRQRSQPLRSPHAVAAGRDAPPLAQMANWLYQRNATRRIQ